MTNRSLPETALLAAGPEPGVDELASLHGRLVAQAAVAGLLDVAYEVIDTPVGPLLVAGTSGGLVRVAFEHEGFDRVLNGLAAALSPRILAGSARLDEPVRQLEEYFAGARRRFELPLDLRLARGFRRTVLEHLGDVGYGSTASYGAVAAAVAHPRAARAVGTACATNPLPVIIPCHRVVRADGSLGSYLGGVAAKRWLLELEAA